MATPAITTTAVTLSHGACRSVSISSPAAEVVRDEQRGQRDHDQVVEEQRPTRDEPDEVVERPPREGLRAAGLGHRGRALGVRERDDEEEQAGEGEDDGRQAERRAATMPSAT